MICHIDFIGNEELRLISAFASFALISKILLEWLLLFDGTAFYIRLIQEAISDIMHFLIIFLITILLFATPTALISLNWEFEDEEAGSQGVFDVNPFAILYNQYLTVLGEFPVDDWEDGMPFVKVIKFFFFLTTFLQTIIMLNMLIAIMMETFTRINSNAIINNSKLKIETISKLEFELLPQEFKKKHVPFKLVVIQAA